MEVIVEPVGRNLSGARDLRHCQVTSQTTRMRLTALLKPTVLQADDFHRVGKHPLAGRGTMAPRCQPLGNRFITLSFVEEVDHQALHLGRRG